jgi:hypothetical protein
MQKTPVKILIFVLLLKIKLKIGTTVRSNIMAFEIDYLIGSLDTYFRQDEINVLFFYAKDIHLELTQKLNYLLIRKHPI